MRRILAMCIIFVFLVSATGCLQPRVSTPPVTPLPPVTSQPAASLTLPSAVPQTTVPQKNVTFSVTQTDSNVTVTYTGGTDAPSLVSFVIQISNRDGTRGDPRTIQNPVIGNSYIFTYRGLANPAVLNIMGTFSDGTQQTILMYYF